MIVLSFTFSLSIPLILQPQFFAGIDASATTIEIRVDVSTYYVQIIDNGTGISPEDLNKVGQRYATSKCHTLDELQKVNTYGFRGEALASIADEAIVEIISKHPGCYDTYSKTIKGGQLIQYGPTRYNNRRNNGTTIIIRDLFYRVSVCQNVNTVFVFSRVPP